MVDSTHDDAAVAAMREDYARGGLSEADLAADPVAMFERWFSDAAGLPEPNAMVVSTVGADGAPSSRMVLLKGFGPDGFRFFTNTGSHKGRDLAANPRCSLLFPWHLLERQVRVDGTAVPLSDEDVRAYASSRPRGSQLGAWASHQSRPVADRSELEAAYAAVEERFADVADDEIPVPGEWGGYRVVPEVVEFWQGRTGRLHDRLVYRRDGEAWRTERLAP